MSRIDKINELIELKKHHNVLERKRLNMLFDENSFVEVGAHKSNAGVSTGYGTINGQLVFAYSQDGPVNVAHATKIARLYEMALKMGNPVIGIMDSQGVAMEDGLDTLEAFGIILKNQSKASGVIPQINIIVGECMGMGSFIPILSDFVVMTENNSSLFMQSPAVIEGFDGKATSFSDFDGSNHAVKTGLTHLTGKTEEECFQIVRQLMSFLPENNLAMPIRPTNDDLNRVDLKLNEFLPEDNVTPIDMRYLISSMSDHGEFLELHKDYAKNIIVGFVRFGGISVGIIANNGPMNIAAATKAGELVNICDAFNIPIVTLTDTAGYDRKLSEEINGIEKYAAKLLYSFANATVPKVNIIVRNAIGNAYMLMNSKHIGADIVYAWPSACIALMDKKAQTELLHTSSEEYDDMSSPFTVVKQGYIDSLVVPSNTRKRVIAALDMLMSKREGKAARKHSSIEF